MENAMLGMVVMCYIAPAILLAVGSKLFVDYNILNKWCFILGFVLQITPVVFILYMVYITGDWKVVMSDTVFVITLTSLGIAVYILASWLRCMKIEKIRKG